MNWEDIETSHCLKCRKQYILREFDDGSRKYLQVETGKEFPLNTTECECGEHLFIMDIKGF